MIDHKAVSISGVKNIARARVLWKDGVLKAYTKNGLVWGVKSEAPTVRKGGWTRHWEANTESGEILMRQRCMTCHGWRKVTKIKAEQLWELQ